MLFLLGLFIFKVENEKYNIRKLLWFLLDTVRVVLVVPHDQIILIPTRHGKGLGADDQYGR